jgi:tetratricopeptide (TPR) repeat protein
MAAEFVNEKIAKDEFQRTCRLTMAAFPFEKVWREFWRDIVPGSKNQPPTDWIKLWQGPASQRLNLRGSGKQHLVRWTYPNPDWANRATQIAKALRHGDLGKLADARRLLHEETRYAKRMGDAHAATLSACNFANSIRRIRPDIALEWLILARQLEPWNARGWNIAVVTLISANRKTEALQLAVETVERFPDDVFARNGLAAVLRAQKRYVDAEAVYRDTVKRFPDNVFVRNGLAEVLKAQKRYVDAEAVYRDTVERFPDNVIARNGFAEVLKAQKRYVDAEAVYRDTVERFPDDVFARTGLAEVLKAQQRFVDAEAVLRDTVKRFPDNGLALFWLALLLMLIGSQHRDEATRLLERAVLLDPQNKWIQRQLEILRESGSFSPAECDTAAELTLSDDAEIALTDDAQLPDVGTPPDPADADFAVEDASSDAAGSILADGAGVSGGRTPVEPADPDHLAQAGDDIVSDAEPTPIEIPTEARVLLTDAFLLRKWSRWHHADATSEVHGQIQQRGKELLGRLQPLWEKDVQIAGEAGLMAIAAGDLDAAVKLLREAVKRFPGSTWVRYALAKAEREFARVEKCRLSDETERRVVGPWRALGRAAEHFVPVQNLGEGRAWLSLVDGATVENNARNSFGKLGRWVHRFIQPVESSAPEENSVEHLLRRFGPRSDTDPSISWWAREVQVYLFGSDEIKTADDIDSEKLIAINHRLDAHRNTLDTLEEEFVRRYSRV